MSADHAITPDMIQRELVRLTDTQDRPSRVQVLPGELAQEGGPTIEVAVIIFDCDDQAVQVPCLPMSLAMMSLDDFSETVLAPLAGAWKAAREAA